MDLWPGAYPETPTPQQQQQEPQYPVQRESERHPRGGQTEQSTAAPSRHPLATEVKPHDIAGGHAHTDSGVGLSNTQDHHLEARTLDDQRNPSVDEAVGGGTYVRPHESFPTGVEGQPRSQHDRGGQPGWPLSSASVQQEQQPPNVHEYHPDDTQRVVREVQQPQTSQGLPRQSGSGHPQQPGDNSLSHGHQPSDLPVSYQQHARDVPLQPHQTPQHSNGLHEQPPHPEHGIVDLSRGHEPSNLPLAYQQNTLAQQSETLPRTSRAVQQPQEQGTTGLSQGHLPTSLPAAYQQDSRSEEPHASSHSGAGRGLAAGALAGAGAMAYKHSGEHDQPSQQLGGVQQQSTTSLSQGGHQPSNIPLAYQQHTRDVPQQPHEFPRQSRATQQAPQGAGISSDLARGNQPSALPVAYQQTTRSHQPHATHREDESHSRAKEGLAAGALAGAGAGIAAHEYSSKHDDDPSQQSAGSHQRPHELRHESRELSQQPHQTEQQRSNRGSPSGAGPHEQTNTTSTPPYWGSLPTAATGGIYNTVTGHGSARDDHDQHHNIAAKGRTADATIPSATTSFPTGGVYNSVTGHGSNDEHDKHHDAGASRMPLLGAGKSRHVEDSTGHGAPSGLESRNVQRSTDLGGPRHGEFTAPSHSHDAGTNPADDSKYGEAGTQRAFPLTTSNRDAHQDHKGHSEAGTGLAAGALAGAGVAAYEYSGKHDQQAGHDTKDVAGSHGQPPTYTEQRAAPAEAASHHTHTQKLQKKTSADDKDKRHQEHHGLFGLGGKHDKQDTRDPPVTQQRSVEAQPVAHRARGEQKEKEHHGLLGGIASKNDMAEGREPSTEHRADPSTHPAGAEHRLVSAQPQAAAMSPPNAEEKQKDHNGLLKHGTAERRNPLDIAPIPGTHPPANAEAKRSSSDGRESPKKKEHHGLFGIFHRQKDDKHEEEPRQHRRSGSIERHNTLKKQPPPKVAQALTSSTPPRKTSVEEARHSQTGNAEHDHKRALASGAGLAAGGVAASELAHRHAESQDASRQPGATAQTSHAQSEPYQTLASGTPSGVATGSTSASHQPSSTPSGSHIAQNSHSHEVDAGHSGPYNTLSDGTPSGIATSGAATHDTSSSAPYDSTFGTNQPGHSSEGSGQYDRLETGTASGIAAGAGAAGLYAASRDSKQAEHYDSARGTGTTAVGPSTQDPGATSGDDWRSQLPPTVATSRVTGPSAAHTTTYDYQTSTPAASQTTDTTRDTQSHAHTTSTTGPYNALESGTASGVAAGAVGAAATREASHGSSHGVKDAAAPSIQTHHGAGKEADLPKPYNVLPSGTPSGVNIEYKRRSKELERQE